MIKSILFILSVWSITLCAGIWSFRINDVATLYDNGSIFTFNKDFSNKDFRMKGITDTALFFCDASAARIGIGTATPGAKLTVSRDSSANSTVAFFENRTSYTTGSVIIAMRTHEGDAGGIRNRAELSAYRNGTDSTGTFAIGTLKGTTVTNRSTVNDTAVRVLNTTSSTSSTTGALTAVSAGIGHVWSDSVHSAKTKLSDSTGLVLKAANGYYYKIKINALGLITADSTGQN